MLKALPLLLALASAGAAAPTKEIAVGLSGALTGPARSLGVGMRAGIDAYFARVNREGGVSGSRLRLLALDDGYDPERAGKNMRQLIEREKVFAILGDPGTPTA